MIKSRLPLPVLAGALTAGASFAFVAAAVSAPLAQDVDLELGKDIYQSQCEPCHGEQGEGDGPAARFLETMPRDLTAGMWMYVEEATIEQVAGIVRDGINDTEMEPFGELLLEEEILAVAAYVIAEFTSEIP